MRQMVIGLREEAVERIYSLACSFSIRALMPLTSPPETEASKAILLCARGF